MNTVTSDATTAVLDNPANQAPVFAEGATTVRLVEENTKALTGTDDDDATADDTLRTTWAAARSWPRTLMRAIR